MREGESRCENYNNHVLTSPTGFCSGGFKQCEGTKPRSPSGKPMPVCKFWLRCPCKCHLKISTMFQIAESPRVLIDNPEWIGGPTAGFVMPDRTEILKEKAATNQSPDVKVIESDQEDIPVTVLREYKPTESGRAARGSLEQNVKLACDAYLRRADATLECSTKWVSEWIAENKEGGLPSRGAINAVFERWLKLGFCMLMYKPTQFVCYTPDGIKFGLDEMKAKAKQRRI